MGEERRARLRAHLLLKTEVLQLVGGGALAQKAVEQKRAGLVQIVGEAQASDTYVGVLSQNVWPSRAVRAL